MLNRHEPVLHTARLRLRPLLRSDLAAVHEAMSDPEVMAYWSSSSHRTQAETAAWLEEAVAMAAAQRSYEWAIEYRGRVAGRVALRAPPWLGYFLSRRAWGKGIGYEALEAVSACALDGLRLPAVRADVDPRNERSRRLLERLGFTETARLASTWRIGATWADSVVLARARPDAPGVLQVLPAASLSDAAVARGLLTAYAAWLGRDLSFQGFEREHRELPGEYAPPGGTLLLAWRLGAPLGMVALRRVDAARAEMKRLFVRPEARGRGVGPALVAHVIGAARTAGYRDVVLDTLPEMHAAQALYEGAGFIDIPPYYDTPIAGTRFLGLAL